MRTLIPALAFIALAAVYVSCNKGNDDNDPPQSFSWQVNGGAMQQSDTTTFIGLFGVYSLFGKTGTTQVYISTNSTNTGSYSHANANAGFGMTIAGVQYNGTDGHISITSNDNRRLAGNFTATMVGPGPTTITVGGSFSNIRY